MELTPPVTGVGAEEPRGVSMWLCSRFLVWAAFSLGLTAFFMAMTISDLGRYPAVHGDESWAMSASHKLATSGVFGSDLYAGFFHADRHYFIALPVHPLLQALSFVMFGSGITQARMVAVVSAVVVLWATTWLALRWYGLLASVITGALLTLLRVNLVDLWPGLPLLSVGRSGRYDMTAVAFVWLTVVFLDLTMRRPVAGRAWPAYAAGVCAGLATLSQFFGAFSVLVIAATLLWRRQPWQPIRDAAVRIAGGWAVVVLPYLAYVALHWSDFRGQSALKAGRTDFHQPSFYLDNLTDEAGRYRHVIDPQRILGNGTGSWLFVIAILPILGWLAWRSRRPGGSGDQLLLTTLVVCGAALALFDSTNAPIYAIVLWPGCCVAVAAAVTAGASWARGQAEANRFALRRPLLALLTVAVLLAASPIVADGVAAYREDRQRANKVTAYMAVAEQLDASLPARAGVIGHERWWWGLHERDYLALNVLYREWARREQDAGSPEFAALFDATGAGALIIDDNARSEIARYPGALQQQIAAFLATRVQETTVVTDPTYGRFEICAIR